MSDTAPVILLVSDDMIFPSRVKEALRPLDFALRVAATENAALDAMKALPAPVAVLVNLTARRYEGTSVVRALKALPDAPPVLAFAGHVEKEKHQAAREAGADMVAANSSVSLHLAALLSRLLAGERPADVQDED